ncbi:hypothetical protein F5Y13DRAFT_206133 [Hypoxylon sp. FL1857]|nr:hypothetical protein F5Y13DRAFT_206133 [Hypoxylon sp. FL1857]
MEHIRGCLRRFRRDKRSKESELNSPPVPPWLPDERPRPLTAVASSPAATANSRFFQCLAPEIRHLILVEAFGERTLHLDLRLEHPLKKDSNIVNARPTRHANAQLFHPSLRDNTQPQEWTWWSCVCHRRSPSSDFRPHPPGVGLHSEEPALDCCRDPSGLPPSSCELYPGQLPGKCFIGVIGWLLACRQAYIEGIHVLYSTNRFHIASAELAYCLPRLLPSQHVAAINEVELSWNIDAAPDVLFYWNANKKRRPRYGERVAMLTRLPQALPNLRYLYLSIVGIMFIGPPQYVLSGQMLYNATGNILRPFEAVIAQMPRLQECRIALPSTWYSTCKLIEKGQDIDWHGGYHSEPEALWRSLPTTDGSTDITAGRQSISGYWLVYGYQDMFSPPLPEVA